MRHRRGFRPRDFDEGELGDLGPCCICEGTRCVRNAIMLRKKAPTPGRGWGCLVCGLPPDGAVAVVCEACFRRHHGGDLVGLLRFACRGYPASDGRVPIGELKDDHEHDMTRHGGEKS